MNNPSDPPFRSLRLAEAAEAPDTPDPALEPKKRKGKRRKLLADDGSTVKVREMAGPARLKRRHWGVVGGFAAVVLLPLALIAGYLWFVAVDQYSSTTGFTVRQEEGGSATELLGGLAQFAGTSVGSESDVLYEFIQSQQIVEAIDGKLGLIGLYSAPKDTDPVFALAPDATLEELVSYWQRMVRISYDQSTGLIELRVLAFSPEEAQGVAQAIVAESQEMINTLNDQARVDALRYAEADLEEALTRLKAAREALTEFRLRTQILDPQADIQGRMGVLNTLQQQLAEALIEYDILLQRSSDTDPRVVQARQRINVIRARITEERQSFASDDGNPVADEDYPTLMAEYESLVVDREFAEETYRAALAAMDVARANASRQSLYLAEYIQPTFARSSEFPQRLVLTGLAALFLGLLWAILALVYYSIRDRR
ncbi:sugar transporter [Litorisediminicola beolgyonensis]|uniref:Sugar transporter n=1 Tax=Litorisediminicola beolgyonensis TaxID=1173614 RepID=A0ABW3ZND4_9RHOB